MKKRHLTIGFLACLIASLVFAPVVEAAPQKIFALANGEPDGVGDLPGAPRDTILFFDVTDIGNGATSGVFNNDPMFSVWMGYDEFDGELNGMPDGIPAGNREEISALTFNPANGTIYVASFDSGTAPAVDNVGDTQGDWDLYRIDYQELLNDFITNERPRGTIYGRTQAINIGDEQFLETMSGGPSPLWDGVNDGFAEGIPHPSGEFTVHVPGAYEKIGELGKQVPVGASFFDSQLDFVDPETLVFLDASSGLAPDSTEILDFNIRLWERVSTSPGAATPPPFGPFDPASTGKQNQEGGYNSPLNTQSWNSRLAGRLDLDPGDVSDPTGWALVNNDGVLGIWAADNDGSDNGDDIAFYEIDLTTGTATKKELANTLDDTSFATQFGLAENPDVDATTNDGDVYQLFVDKNGDLVIIETGFFDTIEDSTDPPRGFDGLTAEEPRVITVDIADYDHPDSDASGANEILLGGPAGTGFDDTDAYTVTAPIPVEGAIDNDDDVTITEPNTKVVYDKSTGYIYIIDQDNLGIGDIREDLYVFDPATGTIVYSELSQGGGPEDTKPFNPGLFNEGTQIIFTRGDINNDGMVNGDDLAALSDAIAAPTDLLHEWFDLTGDNMIDNDDLAELQNIIGTTPGDFDGDGDIDGQDFLEWQRTDGTPAGLADWQGAYPSPLGGATAGSSAVPEPTSLLLCLCAGLMGLVRR